MKRAWLSRMVMYLALLALAGCGSTAMARVSHYTNHLLLLPSPQPQTRTIQFPPNRMECWAIAHVRSDLKNVRCYDVLTLQLGALHPHPGFKTGFAAIRQCVARLTPDQLRQGCFHFLQACVTKAGSCVPGWTAQTSIEFRTNGRRVRKDWITCGMGMFETFQYHLHWCNATHGLPPFHRAWVTAGDDYEVDIPGVVQVGTEERISIRPDGAVLFRGCCS